MKTDFESNANQAIHRAQLRDDLRQADEWSLDSRVDRYLEINHAKVIGNHYFSTASTECLNLYRDGHFIATVMSTQAVNEGILKFLLERNGLRRAKHRENMEKLRQKDIITQQCFDAMEQIWGSFRNDVHHMNPNVSKICFSSLAKANLQSLAIVESEIFGVEILNGKLSPKQPKYWDRENGGTVPVFLRLGI